MGRTKNRTSVTLPDKTRKILDRYAAEEKRTRSNMVEIMVHAYDELLRTKY